VLRRIIPRLDLVYNLFELAFAPLVDLSTSAAELIAVIGRVALPVANSTRQTTPAVAILMTSGPTVRAWIRALRIAHDRLPVGRNFPTLEGGDERCDCLECIA